jgi:hypothetical protein
MRRRHFIGGSAAFLLIPLAAEWRSRAALAAPAAGAYAFFDERFDRARRIAASWPSTMGPVAVRGDITRWLPALHHAARERALQVHGVTTESFRFCLSILVGEHADSRWQVARLDRDLLQWTLRTTPKLGVQRNI